MPSIDSLPPDQRAVLELVLRRGRTYDEIAQLLSIDRAGVRQRALSALDALGPEASVPAERRALITDYLLGALPPRVTQQVRDRLAQNPAERAWARVIAAELQPIASRDLPEIPPDGGPARRAPAPTPPPAAPEPEAAPAESPGRISRTAAPGVEETRPRRLRRRERREPGEQPRRGLFGPRPPLEPGRERPPSRRGGKMVLVAAAIIVLAVVLSLVLSGGGGKKHSGTTASGATGTSTHSGTTSTSGTGATTTTGTSGAKLLAQINLKSPTGGPAVGIAQILKTATTKAVAILGQHLKPNTSHNAYAVWLYNSPTDAALLGFVSPAVGSSGKLQTLGSLPSNAGHFHKLIVTVETAAKPKTPGTIVLEGTLAGLT